MPVSVIVAIVSVLFVVGIISLSDALLRVFMRSKNSTDTLVVLALFEPEDAEQAVRYAIKKHPAAKIIVKSFTAEKDKKILEIINKKYPGIVIE